MSDLYLGHEGIDGHRFAAGSNLAICEETGKQTRTVATSHIRTVGRVWRRICKWCATDEEAAASKSLAQLNAERSR